MSKASVLRAIKEMSESGLINSGVLVQLNPDDLTIEVVEASAASHVAPAYPLSAEAPRAYGDYDEHDAEDAWLEWVANVLNVNLPDKQPRRREWMDSCAAIIARAAEAHARTEEAAHA